MNLRILLLASVVLVAGLGCKSKSKEVVIYTSVDQVFSEPIFRAFERETGITVRAVFDTEFMCAVAPVRALGVTPATRGGESANKKGDPAHPTSIAGHRASERNSGGSMARLPTR
ncbi:MAG: hypothetical protein HYY13_00475 [Nitrospirae bacterium]|nr:hypothetical protein [Nitrospirota bacterium]